MSQKRYNTVMNKCQTLSKAYQLNYYQLFQQNTDYLNYKKGILHNRSS